MVINRPALQHVVDRRQHGGRHGHNRLAGPPTRFEPLKQRMQVASLDARRTPGALHQDSLEPGSAGPEPGGAALARTLVVLRAQPGPGDQVSGPGKAAHVHADLGLWHETANHTIIRHPGPLARWGFSSRQDATYRAGH